MSLGDEMYSVGNIVDNHVVSLYGDTRSLTRLIVVNTLKRREISNHYVVYQELT